MVCTYSRRHIKFNNDTKFTKEPFSVPRKKKKALYGFNGSEEYMNKLGF